jgi:hypothetical protein
MPEATAISTPKSNGATNGHRKHEVTFPELVQAYHQWETSDDGPTGEARLARFKEMLDEFQARSGNVIDAYWCHREASAVALTRREYTKRTRFGRTRKIEYRLHRVSDWVVGENHEIADLLHDSDILAIKAASSLEGVPRMVVMQWLLLVDSHLLGFLERYRDEPCHPAVAELFAANERAELRRIEEYYFRAGEKRARMRYVAGMVLFGVALVAAVAAATAGVLAIFHQLDVQSESLQEFYAAAAAGGVGAVISVLMRMSRGSFAIDHELARRDVMLIGAYRPLIGSVSGIVIYFIVQTPLVPIQTSALTLPFFVVVAFLAGFSERWTTVVLSGAMRTIGEHGEHSAETAAVAAAAPPPSDVLDTQRPHQHRPSARVSTSAGS